MAFGLYAITTVPDVAGFDTDTLAGRSTVRSILIGAFNTKTKAEAAVENLQWTYTDGAETIIVTADHILGFKILEVP